MQHRRAGDEIVTSVINICWTRTDPPGIVVDSAEFYPDHA
jgi:hypothetical protein